MTSEENEREKPLSPDGDGMNLLIGWRAGEEKAAGEPEPDGNVEDPAEMRRCPEVRLPCPRPTTNPAREMWPFRTPILR